VIFLSSVLVYILLIIYLETYAYDKMYIKNPPICVCVFVGKESSGLVSWAVSQRLSLKLFNDVLRSRDI
jgi:hypothetical protein